MKKIITILLAFILAASSMALTVSADPGLPFDVTAPGNVSVAWLEGNDSPTTMALSYSLSNGMTEFFKDLEEANIQSTVESFMSRFDFQELMITTQVDWALDDPEDPVSCY